MFLQFFTLNLNLPLPSPSPSLPPLPHVPISIWMSGTLFLSLHIIYIYKYLKFLLWKVNISTVVLNQQNVKPSLKMPTLPSTDWDLNKSRLLDKEQKVFSYFFECTETDVNSLLPDLFLTIKNCYSPCVLLLNISYCWEEEGRTETRGDGELGL